MKIGFRADGSPSIGMGHLIRCSSLAEQFLHEGDSVIFYCQAVNAAGIQWLTKKGYVVFPLQENSLGAEAQALTTFMRNNNTEILFIDSYSLNSAYFKTLKDAGFFTVAIDDDAQYEYECDILINYGTKANLLPYEKCTVKQKLLGSKYTLLRQEFINTKPAVFHPKVSTILITMGGADVNNYTPVALRGLANMKDIHIIILYGPLMGNMTEILEAKKCCKGNVTILDTPANIAEIMSQCDLAISSGGTTAFELFAMGVVPLFILQVENQLPLAPYLQQKNLPLCLGYYSHVSARTIEKSVAALMEDIENRSNYHRQIQALVDRNGAHNILTEVKTMYHQKGNNHESI